MLFLPISGFSSTMVQNRTCESVLKIFIFFSTLFCFTLQNKCSIIVMDVDKMTKRRTFDERGNRTSRGRKSRKKPCFSGENRSRDNQNCFVAAFIISRTSWRLSSGRRRNSSMSSASSPEISGAFAPSRPSSSSTDISSS